MENITPAITPGVTPDVTPAITRAVTSGVTPDVTPAITPAVTADDLSSRRTNLPYGRNEINLGDWLIAILDNRQQKTVKRREIVIERKVEGRSVQASWAIIAGPYGITIPNDVPIILALQQLAYEQQSQTVSFTVYELARRVGFSASGSDYKNILNTIRRLNSVIYQSEHTFYDLEQDIVVRERGFKIVDEYEIAKNANGATEPSFVKLSDAIYKQMLKGGSSLINMTEFMLLSTPIGQKLYLYLTKVRYDGKPSFQINLKDLAYHHIGMDRDIYKSASQIKRRIDVAHEEMIAMGFITEAQFVPIRDTRAEYHVKYVFGDGDPDQATLAKELMKRKVGRGVAYELVKTVDPEKIRYQINAFDMIKKHKPFRIKSDGGWLSRAIKGEWHHPELEEINEAKPTLFAHEPGDEEVGNKVGGVPKPPHSDIELTLDQASEILGEDGVARAKEEAEKVLSSKGEIHVMDPEKAAVRIKNYHRVYIIQAARQIVATAKRVTNV
jgi:hypothetical protein